MIEPAPPHDPRDDAPTPPQNAAGFKPRHPWTADRMVEWEPETPVEPNRMRVVGATWAGASVVRETDSV